MKADLPAKYVRRTFQVLLHSVTFKTQMGLHFHSSRSAQEHSLSLDCTLKLNRTVPLSTVDLVFPDTRSVDSSATLELYSNELPVGSVVFDIRKERLVKEDSKSIFRKAFTDKSGGYIDYKFLSVRTDIISEEEVALGEERRNRVLLRKLEDYQTIKKQNAEHQAIEKEKDRLIEGLQDKVSRLIQQNVDQGRRLNEEIERLRAPMNIHVNILSNKERALSSDSRGRNVENIIRDLSVANEEVHALRKRLQLVEVDNQKLSENCRILIEELRDNEGKKEEGDRKVKRIEKRLSEVDSEYLLTKTIANYDKTILSKAIAMPKMEMHENLREINELLQQSNGKLPYSKEKEAVAFEKERERSPLHSLRQKGGEYLQIPEGLRSSVMLSNNKHKTLRESHFSKHHKVTPRYRQSREPQPDLKGSGSLGSIKSQLGPGPRQSLFIHSRGDEEAGMRSIHSRGDALSLKQLKEDVMRGSAHLERKEKEVEILENQLRKKQGQVQRLTLKQNDYEKQIQEYQEEKARLFGNLAINSLSQGGKTSPEQASAVRQLNAYNAELLKEKQALLEELRQIKLENIQKGRKVDSYQLATRKSLLFMTQLTKEKEAVEGRLKEAAEGGRASETRLLAQKGAQYEALKAQFIECQQEGTQSRAKIKDFESVNSKLVEEGSKMAKELQELRMEKARLKIEYQQRQGIESQVKLMDDRYAELQKLQKGLKAFVMKLESQMNLSLKKKDEELYQAEMKGLLKETYTRINQFEESYYQTLLDAATVSQQAIQRYYDDIGKLQAEAANSVEKQEVLWNNRMTLLKERQTALKPLREKEQNYKQKKQKKLLLIQDEYQSFLEQFTKLNMRLGELQSYRISLKELINEGRVAEFTVQTERDKQNISVSSINERDIASPTQLRSSLIKSTARSKAQPKQTTFLDPIVEGKNEQRKLELNKSLDHFKANNREDLEALRQMQTSRLAKMQEESQRLKESFSENLSLRGEMSRVKLEYSKNETRLKQNFIEKQRELQRQLTMEKNDKESLNIRLRQAQSKLQVSMKRVEAIHDNKLEILQQEFDTLTLQNRTLKEEIASMQALLEKAGDELQQLSKEERKARDEIQQLNVQRDQLQMRLKGLEQSENILLQEVREMKEETALHEMEVGRTIEELSGNFVSIEKVKTVQIQKLKGIIEQIQARLQEQTMEAMSNRERMEELMEQIRERDTIMTQRQQQWKMTMEQLQRELNIQRDARENLENQNRQYHSHVLELSDNMEGQEREIVRLNILLEGNIKQKRTLQDMAQRLTEKQKSVKEQGRRVEQSLREKNQQIHKWQQNYQQLQTEVRYISRQLEKTKTQNTTMKEQNDAIREQLFEKQREIISIDKEKGIAMINIEKLHLEIEGMSTQMAIQQTKIKEFLQEQEHHNSLRISDKNHGKSLDKSRRNDLSVSKRNDLSISRGIPGKQKQEDSFFSNRQMKVSRRLPDLLNFNGTSQQLKSSERPISKGLLVPVMKTNKMLNLPSIDSDPPFTEQQYNLQIIQEHNEELNDTFLDNKPQNPSGSGDLISIRIKNQNHKRVDEQNRTMQSNNHYRADQSAVHIVADFNESEEMNVPRFESPQTFARGLQEQDEDEYDGVRRQDLLQEIAKLKQELAEAQRGDPFGISQIPQNQLRQTNKSSFFSKEIQTENALRPQKSMRILKFPSRDSNNNQLQSENLFLEERNKELEAEKESLQRELSSMKAKLVNDELFAAEMEQRVNMAQKEAEEQQKNVNELMEELRKVSEFNCLLQSQMEKMKQEYTSLKERMKAQFAIYETKCQELVGQSLQKDNHLYELELQLGKAKQDSEGYGALFAQQERQIRQTNKRIHSMQVDFNKQRTNYIKYQQQSELQILHLKEETDAIKEKLHQKQEEMTLLAEKYLLMEETNCSLLSDLKQQEIHCEKNEKVNNGLLNKFQSVRGQINANELFRKNTLRKIHELQVQNLKLSQNIANVTKTASIQAQKWTIKLNSQKENFSYLQQKLKDKQSTILRLKNEIALYNEQCIELKSLNESLSGQLLKAERSLKDVMILYESEFKTLTQQANSKAFLAVQASKTAKNAQRDYDTKNKEVRECREEIKQLKNENQDIRNKLQTLKLEYNRTKADFSQQMQHKKDELQTLRTNLKMGQRITQEIKTQQRIKQLEQGQKNLQRINAQLKAQIQKLSKKPTKDTLNKDKDIMISVLQQKLRKTKEQLQRYKSIPQKPQINIQPLQKEMQALQKTLLLEKQKNAHLCQDLKQVVEAFKSLEQEQQSLKEKNEKLKKNNHIISTQSKHLQRQVKELQLEIEQLQKDLSSFRFSRMNSFSKILTDTTIK